MTIQEIAYMILETVRSNEIMDDEKIDVRLIYDWIDLKRAQYIKNQVAKNPNNRLNLNLYQTITVTTTVQTLPNPGLYPYAAVGKEETKIVESSTIIPTIIEGKSGPLVFSIESEDAMKFPFSFVDFGYLRFAGNGKFNSNLIYSSIRDNKLYFKYHTFFDSVTTVVLRAIFENPRSVPGYVIATTRYPANLGLIEYIKNAIFETDIKVAFTTKSDETNNADGAV